MQSKITPGPWNAGGLKPYKGNEANIFDTSDPEKLICRAYGSIDDKCPPLEEQLANSYLISAAPDLLSALELMVGLYDNGDFSELQHSDSVDVFNKVKITIRIAKLAIDKAVNK